MTMSQEDGMNTTPDVSSNFTEITAQPNTQHQQSLLLIKLNFFHNPPNDNNFYHITCERVQEYSLDDHDYDHAFFYSCLIDLTANFHVKCKLLSYSRIIDLLNKEIYEVEFYINNSPRDELSLSLHQKLNLEKSLSQKLDLYFLQCHMLENYNLFSISN